MPENIAVADTAARRHAVDVWRRKLERLIGKAAGELGNSACGSKAEIADLIEMAWPELQRHFAKKPEW